jgi:hypothetical protein
LRSDGSYRRRRKERTKERYRGRLLGRAGMPCRAGRIADAADGGKAVDAQDASDRLLALIEARARLEAALQGNENWRALHHTGAGTELHDARHERDRRLQIALESDPLYGAWLSIGEAIAALDGERERPLHATPQPDLQSQPADGAAPSMPPGDDLPEEIRTLIRAGSHEEADAPTEKALPESMAGATAQAAAADMPAEQEKEASPPSRAAVAEPPGALEDVAGRIERLEVEVLELSGEVQQEEQEEQEEREPAGEPAPKGPAVPAIQEPNEALPAELSFRPVPEPDEATVTFVVREPRGPMLPAAELPADLGTPRKSALFDRLRSLSGAPPPDEDCRPTLNGPADEAQVEIVKEDGKKPSETVRRFMKALSGR